VSLKVRFADFSTITRARTLPAPTDAGHEVYATARALYDGLDLDGPRIRLVGVRVEGIAAAGDAARQLELGGRERGWRDADRAVDRAVDRFGSGAVRPATLVSPTTQNTGASRHDTPEKMSDSGRVERS
jgi:DNA polymerase IV